MRQLKYRDHKPMRVDPTFKKELDEILNQLIAKNKLKREKARYPRITKAMQRSSTWLDMKNALLNAEYLEE